MPLPPIQDAVTIITGASSGIGKEASRAFARAGAQVVLASRNEPRLRELALVIESYPARALVVPTDVTNDADIARLAREATEWKGRIDVIICNAGVGLYGAVKDLPEEALRLELSGTGVCVQMVYPALTATEFPQNSVVRNPRRDFGRMKPMPAAEVARQMLRAARRGSRDHIVTAGGKVLAFLNGLAPGLTDSIVRSVVPPSGGGPNPKCPT